jgi:hypothetical protein
LTQNRDPYTSLRARFIAARPIIKSFFTARSTNKSYLDRRSTSNRGKEVTTSMADAQMQHCHPPSTQLFDLQNVKNGAERIQDE